MTKLALICLTFFTTSIIAYCQKPIQIFQSINNLVAVDRTVFVSANDGKSGTELWITDGTAEGTRLVKDIFPGIGESSPTSMINFKHKLFFVAYNPEFEHELWSSDGTSIGTKLFANLAPSGNNHSDGYPQMLTIFNDNLYFTASNGGLYKTNGEEGNLTLVDKMEFGRYTNLTVAENYLYYYDGSNELNRTDGNTNSVIPMQEDNGETYFSDLKVTEQHLIAIRTSSNSEIVKLFRWSEATSAWIQIRTFSNAGNDTHRLANFTAVGNSLYFSVKTNFNNSPLDELWITDGTAEGTKLLKSFYWHASTYDSDIRSFVSYQGNLYFRSGMETSKSMWKSDGTASGTVKFNDVIISHPIYQNNPPAVNNNKLYFAGNTAEYSLNTSKLWVTDGTSEGTKPYLELMQEGNALPYRLTNAEELIYFITNESQNNFTLWNSESSPELSVTDNALQPIPSNAKISFLPTLVNYCKSQSIKIYNLGLQELAISRLEVTGSDFVINGVLPELLESNKNISINITFNPVTKGNKEAILTIYTNDVNEGKYIIHLFGEANLTTSKTNCVASDKYDRKILYSITTDSKLKLNATMISELMPPGTTVGSLSITGSTVLENFRLTAGVGDADNADFFIQDSQLKTNRTFDYSRKQLYTVRIKGYATATETIENYFLIQISNKPTSLSSMNCARSSASLNYSLNDIKINSAGHLFTISNDGRILRSTDQGASWDEISSQLSVELNKIEFRNNVGYITGNGSLFKSEDNGANWFKIYIPFSNLSTVLPLSTFFIDENKGYASDYNGELIYTPDGGRSWEKRTQNSARLKSMWFWDTLNGITISGSSDIIKTKDGGNTWTLMNTISNLSSLWFINQKLGFASSYDNLYRSRDGGETWNQVATVNGAGIEKVYFVNDKIGYLIGSSFYKSIDGGETWKQLALPGPFITGIANVNNETNGKIITISRGYYYGVGRGISTSTDGGATWQSTSDLISSNLYSICFVNNSVGYMTGEYTVFKTTDKGITWKSLEPGPRFISVYAIDTDNAVFSDGTSIYRTSDGGATIGKVYANDGDPAVYVPSGKLKGVDENTIFAYSWQALHRSIDGGKNWQLISAGEDFLTQDIFFISATVGYRLALFGTVQKTIDSGATWQEIFTHDPEASDPYNAVFFLNESMGFKGGKYLSKTSDGGITWKRFYNDFKDIININFSDEQNGFIMTRTAGQFETSDGGNTWKRVLITSYEITSTQVSVGTIYYTDADGRIGKIGGILSKPLQPGYIFGKEAVCKGDAQIYSLPNDDLAYQWNISGALIDDTGSTARVVFPEAGEYNFEVYQSNGCGISEPRSKKVVALELPSLELSGTEILVPGEEDVPYLISNPKPATEVYYSWDVKGASDLRFISSSSILVTWSKDITEARVSSFITELKAGCRNRKDKKLTINTTVGFTDQHEELFNAYPNPISTELNIISTSNNLLTIKLHDVMGRIYYEGIISPNQEQKVILRNAPAGLYILHANDGNSQVVTRKIIKN